MLIIRGEGEEYQKATQTVCHSMTASMPVVVILLSYIGIDENNKCHSNRWFDSFSDWLFIARLLNNAM